MDSFSLSGFKWYGTKAELHKLMESTKGKLIDESEWDVVNNEQLEMYDAEKFLEKGYEHVNKKPADMIQSAQKFWLAATWTLKRFYLTLGLNIESHSAMSFFVKFALECDLKKTTLSTHQGWMMAEEFHHVEYGHKAYALRDFMANISEVECFVKTFPEQNVNAVRPELEEFLKKECEEPLNAKVRIVKKKESVKFGKEQFDCLYTAY